MIVILSGVTGVGKSYFKKQITQRLGFKNIVIVTTMKKREGEKDGVDKNFVTDEEFEELKNNKKISVAFEFLGNKYAYYTRDLINLEENSITELHYDTIEEFKKTAKDVVSIYLRPISIDLAKEQLKKRGLPKDIENQRLKEMEEQIEEFEKNKKIQEQFDCVFYNDYTDKTLKELIEFIDFLSLKEGII